MIACTSPKSKGPEVLEHLPSHVPDQSLEGKAMNSHVRIMPAAIASSVVSLPATRIADVDLADRVLDQLRVAHCALNPDNSGSHDHAALFAVWATIERAMIDLAALREHLADGGQ